MVEAVAYVDESFHEHPTDGFYVLAAAVITGDPDHARDVMRGLRGSRQTQKLHWNEMDRREQRKAAQTVAALDGLHLVTVGSPVPRRKQQRARNAGLQRLVYELSGLGVEQMVLESRQQVLDQRDVELVVETRYGLPKGTALRVDHQLGADEPLFWVSDIVAGAVRAHRQGLPMCREILDPVIHVIEVAC